MPRPLENRVEGFVNTLYSVRDISRCDRGWNSNEDFTLRALHRLRGYGWNFIASGMSAGHGMGFVKFCIHCSLLVVMVAYENLMRFSCSLRITVPTLWGQMKF